MEPEFVRHMWGGVGLTLMLCLLFSPALFCEADARRIALLASGPLLVLGLCAIGAGAGTGVGAVAGVGAALTLLAVLIFAAEITRWLVGRTGL